MQESCEQYAQGLGRDVSDNLPRPCFIRSLLLPLNRKQQWPITKSYWKKAIEEKAKAQPQPLAGKGGKAKAKAKAQPLAGAKGRWGLGLERPVSRVAFSPFMMRILITSGVEL